MKKLPLKIFTLLFSVTIFAQNVHIPDANFKKALVEYYPTIDTNRDGEIQISEAEAYTKHISVAKKILPM